MLVSRRRCIRCFVVIARVRALTLQNSQVMLHLLESKSWHAVPTKHPADVRLLPRSSFFPYPYNHKGGLSKLICNSCGVADHLRALLVFQVHAQITVENPLSLIKCETLEDKE